ncbi:MAG: hypothetical protein HRT73_10155 [Flavobacteriales bacterium]|nr:hypothetical protein [Flavobacteriales bacterium]
MKIIFIIALFFTALSIKAQGKQYLLNNKTFLANVGLIWEETPDENPCAGQQVYLVLEFKEAKVLVLEKYISSCEKEEIIVIGNYKWILLGNNRVKIVADPKEIEDTYFKKLILEFSNGQLLGTRINGDNSISEFIFIDTL